MTIPSRYNSIYILLNQYVWHNFWEGVRGMRKSRQEGIRRIQKVVRGPRRQKDRRTLYTQYFHLNDVKIRSINNKCTFLPSC
jgi:hypothetical protein